MTDRTGKLFLSYRRTRVEEVRLLIEAQHDVGIPTWQDLTDLEHGHTERQLQDAIGDQHTANAVCWLTPDVETSVVITKVELPAIMLRIDEQNGFFALPVAAGGLDYTDVTRVVGTYVRLHDFAQWNVHKTRNDPITPEDAAAISRALLKRRLTEIVKTLPPATPLTMVLNTRKKPAFVPGVALSLDWTHRFNGRLVNSTDAWARYLLPALESVAQTIEENAPGRELIAEGLCALPAAVALGTTFLATRRLPVAWRQISPSRGPQLWSLRASPAPSGFAAEIFLHETNADDLALLVSVASPVDAAFAASRASLPKFRAIVSVRKEGNYPHDLTTSGQAADVARVILEGLRKARAEFQPRGALHLFLAVPAGLAMMIGQVLNTFGPVQTYEHIASDAVGTYQPAALLTPSS